MKGESNTFGTKHQDITETKTCILRSAIFNELSLTLKVSVTA